MLNYQGLQYCLNDTFTSDSVVYLTIIFILLADMIQLLPPFSAIEFLGKKSDDLHPIDQGGKLRKNLDAECDIEQQRLSHLTFLKGSIPKLRHRIIPGGIHIELSN